MELIGKVGVTLGWKHAHVACQSSQSGTAFSLFLVTYVLNVSRSGLYSP